MHNLTEVTVRNLEVRSSAYQTADGGGLVIETRPSGQKAWLYRYRVYGRQEKLSLGTYPEITLKEARKRHQAARAMLEGGKSPAQAKQAQKQRLSADLQVVRGLAKAYIEDHLSKLASSTHAEGYVRKEILPSIGSKFIHEVTPANCVAIVERIRQRGTPAVARKVLVQLRGLFDYAVDRQLLSVNPAAQIRATKLIGAPQSREKRLTGPEIKKLLDAIQSFPTSQSNRIAFQLILLTLCRKGELIKTRIEHLDLDRGEWLIPAENAKNGQELIVYLSKQAKKLFAELIALAGSSQWLLPGRNPDKHIGVTTLNQAMYVVRSQNKQSAWLGDIWIHDFRRTGSTILHEAGWPPHVIEKALNHTVGGVAGVYNRALYAEQRREMLQWWGDFIDSAKAGDKVVPIRQKASKKAS